MPSFLDALIGRSPQGPTAIDNPDPSQPPINVGAQNPASREGLLRGGFSVGHTGGNILGLIGDALLVSAGRHPIYQDRVRRQRAGDAVEGLADDPLGVMKNLGHIGEANAALGLYDKYNDNQRMDRSEARLNEDAAYRRDLQSGDRVASMLGVANEKNWSTLVPRVQAYAKSRGYDIPWELPEKYDSEFVDTIRNGSVKTKDQMTISNTQDYRNSRLGQIDRNLDSQITDRTERRGETGRHNLVNEGLSGERNDISQSRENRIAKVPNGGEPIQTKNGAVSYDKAHGTAEHTNAQGVRTLMKKIGGKWVPQGRIVPNEDGGMDKFINVNGQWVKKAE